MALGNWHIVYWTQTIELVTGAKRWVSGCPEGDLGYCCALSGLFGPRHGEPRTLGSWN